MATLTEIEKLAFELPEQQRATLASHILDSLPAIFSETEDELAEAIRRDAEMDAAPGIGVDIEQLDQFISKRRVP